MTRPNQIALQMHSLGVSRKAIIDILSIYPYDQIEAQLEYLPFRKARRPEAFIVDAIRYNYSAPKEFFYAKNKAKRNKPPQQLDQDPESPTGQLDAETQGYGIESPSGAPSPHDGLEPGGTDPDPLLPDLDLENWA